MRQAGYTGTTKDLNLCRCWGTACRDPDLCRVEITPAQLKHFWTILPFAWAGGAWGYRSGKPWDSVSIAFPTFTGLSSSDQRRAENRAWGFKRQALCPGHEAAPAP